MPLISFQQFREVGLGDMSTSSDVGGQQAEIINDIIALLRNSADKLIPAINALVNTGELDPDAENDVKRLAVLATKLRENPDDKKKRLRDPMSNVVARPFQGPDGPGNGIGGGEQ